MAENTISRTCQATFPSEAQKEAIRMLFRALSADYGKRFTSQFEDRKIRPGEWKWRLAREIECVNPCPQAIVDGAQDAIDASPNYPPTIPQLAAYIRERQRQMNKERAELERARKMARLSAGNAQAGLPPPSRSVKLDVMESIRKAETVSREELMQMIEEHEKVIESLAIERPKAEPCCVPGCRNPGTISMSTANLSGIWYCREHCNRNRQ